MTRRVVIPGIDVSAEVVVLPRQPSRHIARVLRLGRGDEILVLDGRGIEAKATIEGVVRGQVTVRIDERSFVPVPSLPTLQLVQALPKGGKLDGIVRHATELGVTTITPTMSERSVARPSPSQLAQRLVRWRTIGVEAARQCRRAHIPTVEEIASLDEAFSKIADDMLRVMLWEGETSTSLAQVLSTSSLDHGVALVIGPEGGFSEQEATRARELGFRLASLGSLVLRVETAALAACTVAQLFLGGFETGLAVGAQEEDDP